MGQQIFTTRVKKLAAKRLFWEISILLLTPFSFAVLSVVTDNWTWFARSGSLMVAISIFTFGLSFVRAAKADELKQATYARNESDDAPPPRKFKEKHITHYTEESQFHYGLGFIGGIVGTLIWGFGDLIGLMY